MRKGNLYYRFNYTLQGLRERATNATSSWQCGCNKDKQGGGERERGNQLNQGHLLLLPLLPSSSASWSRWVSYGRMQERAFRDQRWLVTWWIKFQFWTCTTCDISFDLFNRTLFRANSRESCTLYCPHRYSLLVNNTACSPTPLRGMRFVCTLPGPAFSPAFACFTHNEFTPDQITWNHEWTRARIPAYRGNGNEEKHTIMSSQEIAR